jgi:ubiquinone/menaquinone biosynthesis C-methylase UbiE
MKKEDIKDFYDDFLTSRMLDYRIKGNKRIDKAISRVSNYLNKGDKVLDVGCGIGLAAEKVSKIVGEKGKVWACDISNKNIWYAKKTVKKKNISFFVADLISEKELIEKAITPDSLDVIYLIDVIEHIPVNEHQHIFELFVKLLNKTGYLVLTYPSPQYQDYLKKNNSGDLQIIDQVIELDHLQDITSNCNLFLKHYSLEKVWEKHNQYVHCVFQTNNELRENDGNNTFSKKVTEKLKFQFKKSFIYPIRHQKYINSIFKD